MLYLTPYKVTTTAQLDEFTIAKPGTKYLVVLFHEINRDDVQQRGDSNDFKLAIPDGQVLDTSFDSPTPDMDQTMLDAGGHADGGIVFDVPRSVHSASLRWAPQPLNYDAKWPTYTWKLTF